MQVISSANTIATTIASIIASIRISFNDLVKRIGKDLKMKGKPIIFVILLVICLTISPVQSLVGYRSHISARDSLHFSESNELMEIHHLKDLCQSDPVQLLEESLRRYRKSITGYTCKLIKKERVNNKERPEEEIFCAFRERPFSIFMEWIRGKDRADATLFVEGENNNQIAILPSQSWQKRSLHLLNKYFASRSITDSEVISASRYPVREFGIACGTERTYLAWKHAKSHGRFRFKYLGEKPVPQIGNRLCHLICRSCDPPEEEGLTQITIYIDSETWLQVGSVLMANDKLIGYYFFKDIDINPTFAKNQFSSTIFMPR